ncbi:MAG: prephenate dehydratase [Bacteroidota bacterium]
MTLATLGPAGTHSEAAARSHARIEGCSDPVLVFAPVEECLALVAGGEVESAVVPAENLVDGPIGATYDALVGQDPPVSVADEVVLPIEHVLAVGQGEPSMPIRRVYSHPSALNQCARNLRAAAPGAVWVPVGSTAEAAVLTAGGAPGDAAVCSPAAAAAHGLTVRLGNLGDHPGNHTRFFVCRRQPSTARGNRRTLLAVHYGQNRPGQLYRTAGSFARRGVDLTSVHSRPYRGHPGRYVLFFEADGDPFAEEVAEALEEVRGEVGAGGGWLRVLGTLPGRRED